jgi:lauroyl/myristoyl acyltransferase
MNIERLPVTRDALNSSPGGSNPGAPGLVLARLLARLELRRAMALVRVLLFVPGLIHANKRRKNWERFFLPPGGAAAQYRAWRTEHRDYIARVIVELCRNSLASPADDAALPLEGVAHIEAARRAGRGVMLFSGHCGPWWQIPATLSARGYSVTVVFRPPALRRAANYCFRRARDYHLRFAIVGQGAAREIRAALQDRAVLCVLGDAVAPDSGGTWFPFGPAWLRMNRGPAILAARYQAVVLHAASRFRADGGLQLAIRPFLEDPPGSVRLHPDELCRRWLGELAREVQDCPAQWFLWRQQELQCKGLEVAGTSCP